MPGCDGVGPRRRSAGGAGGGGGGLTLTPGRMETQARRVARQMTVDFVTINYDGVSGGEDDSSISSSSRYVMFSSSSQQNNRTTSYFRPSSATFSHSSGSDRSMRSSSDVVVRQHITVVGLRI